jgi:hypothetical protein
MKKASLIALVLLSGCAAQEAKEDDAISQMLSGRAPNALSAEQLERVQKHPLGSRENPVRVQGVEGEYRYLARLRCPEGKPPVVDRIGSAGDPSPYGSIMDMYDVVCDAPPNHVVFVDMYHPGHVESAAVPGFTIVAPEAK